MIELQFLKVGDAEPVLQYRNRKTPIIVTIWQDVPFVDVEAPPPASRHWSDVLDVALDANREKVEEKYTYAMCPFGRDCDNKLEIQLAWEQYLNDIGQRK